jgi:hypothetical protein
VAGLHTLVSRRVHELRGPRVAELVAVADEHVQNRHLLAFRGLRVVVTVVGVLREDRSRRWRQPRSRAKLRIRSGSDFATTARFSSRLR